MLSQKSFLQLAKLYTSGAFVIGLLEVVDGCMHALGMWADWRLLLSVCETCWFPVSLFLIFVFKRLHLPPWLPVAFAGYLLVSFILAGVLMSDDTGTDDSMILPFWFGWIAALFGLFYSAYAYKVYVRFLIRVEGKS